ncbi:single-stranded-DNA-specific exonuclease RecJ [bacterium]|nr:single-stranded-DNA-specific exonuclease RecJ [bacterium]
MLHPRRLHLRPTEPESATALAQALDLPEVVAQLLIQRNLRDEDEARSFLFDDASSVCSDPMLFRDMALAVPLIERAIHDQELIFIHGDYDVDGVCSTVLLVEGLTALGATVEHHVPDRFTEGYGVSIKAVEAAAERGAKMLLTCDCGSSSHSAIELAQQRGMTVIVTDHHSLPNPLPTPEAFINPQLSDCAYPFKPMCGATIAYKLVCALYQQRGLAWPDHFLDLVAVATIADVMPLLGENRGLVRSGLRQLALLQRPGWRALAQVAGLEEGPWGSFAVGFGLGPRINAAGRLENAKLAVDLLLTQDDGEARKLASYLDKLNQQRRDLEAHMRSQVEERLEAEPAKLDLGVVVEAGDEWHQGVVGITASRVVDRYGLPAFIMGRVGEVCKGSARAPENVNLFQAMHKCADVFVKFGGHARAAGFTIAWDRVDEMRQRLAAAVAEVRQGPAPVHADMELSLRAANLDLARQLRLLEPLGEANRTPVFLARRVRLEQLKTMGKAQEHLRFRLVQGELQRKAVAFRLAGDREQILEKQLYYDVLFELEEESWEGASYPSLRVQALLEPEPQVFALLQQRPQWSQNGNCPSLVDGRNVVSRRAYLEALLEQGQQPLVVVHDDSQRAKVQAALPQHLLTMETYANLRAGFEDVVLLYPPSSLPDLLQPALQQAARVHVLFGGRELRQEVQRQSDRWLDRPRLEGIWKSLVRHARQGRLEQQQFPSIEEDIRPLKASALTLSQAVEVFEELQLVERKPDSWIIRASGGRRLEESRRYQEMCRGREQFMQLVQRFDERHLRLEERLVGV